MSILIGALQLSPVVFGQGPSNGGPGHGGRWQQRLANLSPEERQKLMAARQKAMQDPAVQAAHDKMREARREFMTSMHAAMLKADPTIQPVLDKIPKGGRGDRNED